MSKKIAFIGAGSIVFTRNLVRDLLTFPAFQDCEIALMDIHEGRLETITNVVNRIIKAGNYQATVLSTLDRAEALQGADGVITTVLQGGVEIFRHDIEIPKQYGVDINIGDTRGPAGIFRAMRTIPLMLDICKDIEKYCPDAVLLNYTNPMAMLCRAIQSETKVLATGLCHSVQATANMLARWIGAPMDEVTYTCAGINHQAFYLDFKWNGKDAYPLIRKAMEKPKVYNEEKVRNEMYLAFDYYVTESSGHNSEYNAWFRKRQDLIDKYCIDGTGWNPGKYAYSLELYEDREKNYESMLNEWMENEVDLNRGEEYAAYIFNAMFGDGKPFEFNGNVRNFGLIDNLPVGCAVEVPCLASRNKLEPIHVGKLPEQLAVMVNTSAQCEELAVNGILEGDPRKIYQAICYDPLTSAVLSLEEIKHMVNDMFEVNRDYMPNFTVKKV
ncbi:MAG: alpha-galactosidase [Clostridia bacterium]|nr:alpha-galactosidase [Clostridia bacterium]